MNHLTTSHIETEILTLPDDNGEVECQALVRHLPGKRRVYRGCWQGRRIYAKLYIDPARAEIHWRRELTGLQALHDAAVPAPEILFAGAIEAGAAWLLLLGEIEAGESVLSRWHSLTDDGERQLLLQRLVDVLVQHHRAGICQRDMHLDNFFLTPTVIYTLDGADIKARRGELPREMALENLALLLAQLHPRHDHFAGGLFKRYQQGREWVIGEKSELSLGRVKRRREWRKENYLKKSLRDCTAFACQKSSDVFRIVARPFNSAEMQQLFDAPDRSCPDKSRLLKNGNTCTVWQTEVNDQPLVIKRYNVKDFWHGVKLSLRQGRAHISWLNAQRLQFYGISTPQPVALLKFNRDRLRPKGYFITRYVEGIDAKRWFGDESMTLEQKQAMVQKFTAMLSQLDELRITHGDMKATNFLIVEGEPMLIDLDAMKQHRCRYAFARAQRRDRERFMRNWQSQPELYSLFESALPPI